MELNLLYFQLRFKEYVLFLVSLTELRKLGDFFVRSLFKILILSFEDFILSLNILTISTRILFYF